MIFDNRLFQVSNIYFSERMVEIIQIKHDRPCLRFNVYILCVFICWSVLINKGIFLTQR